MVKPTVPAAAQTLRMKVRSVAFVAHYERAVTSLRHAKPIWVR